MFSVIVVVIVPSGGNWPAVVGDLVEDFLHCFRRDGFGFGLGIDDFGLSGGGGISAMVVMIPWCVPGLFVLPLLLRVRCVVEARDGTFTALQILRADLVILAPVIGER